MVILALIIFYLLPKRFSWVVLFVTNFIFYAFIIGNKYSLLVLLGVILSSYLNAIILSRNKWGIHSGIMLTIGVSITSIPLLLWKITDLFHVEVISDRMAIIVPIGLSFFSLQLIAYQIDVYRGQIQPQRNLFKFCTFAMFFPQIIQGPIPRYNQLGSQLFNRKEYSEENTIAGLQLILWGFFLKLMIADKASIVVDEIFNNWQAYKGMYVLVGGILYSIQLYADFLSCTTLSQGVAKLFGIDLMDNFNHPYFSRSVKEFWRRWHISLSTWLRDYVYFPLGGSRCGQFRKWLNVCLTFLISGLWHGNSFRFIFWGILHAFYQICEDVGSLLFERRNHHGDKKSESRVITLFCVMLGWIIFRANSLKIGIKMIISIFTCFNWNVLVDDSLLRLGLDIKEWIVLILSMMVLLIISLVQERGIVIKEKVNSLGTIKRWIVYYACIVSIWIMGTYGYGFNAGDFIYGGF
ncbi:MBOAT family O-acyltransferase [Pseudobutyrivibrio sp. YE44]|uniref:MBOAT family O-acyltransferase n=1 Tax=Pseudobutyrivibrio sp. YE44 TaxID=1520802 RepID=UPI0015A12FB9|nr:MBOAT family O-acyltransferase [Pseudobutyrivibrio sp. YE44]